MKNTNTLVLFFLLLTSASYGQIHYKVKAGGSLASVAFDDGSNNLLPNGTFKYGSKTGFLVGVAAAISFGGDRFSLQPELLFHQKGYSFDYFEPDSHNSASYKTTLNYIDIPVMARATFGNFYFSAGPYFAFGVGGKYKGSDTYGAVTQEREGKVKFGNRPSGYTGTNSYVNAFDVGLAADAGVKIKAFAIGLRYGFGFIDLNEKGSIFSLHNRSLQLSVEFPLLFEK
ncbi:MAG: porin family protein [Chryseolinea sp.]